MPKNKKLLSKRSALKRLQKLKKRKQQMTNLNKIPGYVFWTCKECGEASNINTKATRCPGCNSLIVTTLENRLNHNQLVLTPEVFDPGIDIREPIIYDEASKLNLDVIDLWHVDRTDWPEGPWDNEPDRAEFIAYGFPCIAVRNKIGAWCGYVGIMPNHPLRDKSYNNIYEMELDIVVHGGLTFSDYGEFPMSHSALENYKVWTYGFDCAHAGDLVPGMLAMSIKYNMPTGFFYHESYRTFEYCKNEIRHLARQLRDLMTRPAVKYTKLLESAEGAD